MSAAVLASELRTALGDGPATFAALLAGRDGRAPQRRGPADLLRVSVTHPLAADPEPTAPMAPSRWLGDVVAGALAAAGVDPARERVAVVVGTGLGELGTVEAFADDLAELPPGALDLGDAVRAAVPDVEDVLTLSNACSAGGHALALAQDLVELGDAGVAVAAAADSATMSMLAMIGRVVDAPSPAVRPFDADRPGVLLGDGAAAIVLGAAGRPGALARLRATGLSCDAAHETAPDVDGIGEAMVDALRRAGLAAADVGLVVAHGTGTALNDPAECAALDRVLCRAGGNPLVTAVKGALGHTSGAAALVNADVALRCLATGRVPAVTGLRRPLPEAGRLRLVTGDPVTFEGGAVQVDAFGFGGVNAVTLLEAA